MTLLILLGQVATPCASKPRPIATRDPWVPDLEVEKYQLRNGLTVVLHEDHKTLLVAVNVTYNVGSKDDPPGRTGFAHLFEHVMFKGSQHSDCAYHWPIHPYMARGYASTGEDLTVYRTTVTCNALETVLWLEADRMGFLLPVLTEEKLVNARNVVRMERRQNWIDPQLSEVDEALSLALYPVGVKASHPTLMLAGRFELQLQANHGRQLEELVQIADAEIKHSRKRAPRIRKCAEPSSRGATRRCLCSSRLPEKPRAIILLDSRGNLLPNPPS